MKIYISGPMSGYADHNFPAFYDAERKLQSLGFETLTPAGFKQSNPESWVSCMKLDIVELMKADAVLALPGYERSKGAKIEIGIARDLEMPVYFPPYHLSDKIFRHATIEPLTNKFRYSLLRVWNARKPTVLFVMLNPSTADGLEDDPTIRRCINFAKSWEYGALEVVNLFAYRATDPETLKTVFDPIGPGNDAHITEAAGRADLIVAAWGTKGNLRGRDVKVKRLLDSWPIFCLDVTRDGHPKHPLYVSTDQIPVLYDSTRKEGVQHG